jgi:hypothetical protein
MRVRPKKSLGMDPKLRLNVLTQAFWHINRARDLLSEAECRTETIDKVRYARIAIEGGLRHARKLVEREEAENRR